MMRIKITLKGKDNLEIPYNYNYTLSSLIYNTIADSNLSEKLHSSDSFKFFTFSQINVKQPKFNKNGIIARNGIFSFYLSSPHDKLIQNLTQGFLVKNLPKNCNNPKTPLISKTNHAFLIPLLEH